MTFPVFSYEAARAALWQSICHSMHKQQIHYYPFHYGLTPAILQAAEFLWEEGAYL